ncbi:MAG: hypothetical protein JO320_19130 [Alphaproteobacteria bacterium]|nr:hypothetical protein [Alphaproteobacteria bacterium]MBV9377135.1 hypothetical protein [Alphaproteobacteria bacterium]
MAGLGIAPVVIVLGRDYARRAVRHRFKRRRDEWAMIGIRAHGAWRQVEAAMAARDVPAGESWVFSGHRTMAEVIADETVAA